MIIGNGIDIIEIKRIKDILNKNKRFLKKIFNKEEIEIFKANGYSTQTISGYFAAKEAISKVLGCGIGKIRWHDINISNDELGKPIVSLNGKALLYANKINIKKIHLSITHNKNYAVASAVGEDKDIFELKSSNLEDAGNLITCEFVKNKLKQRKSETHKGDYGKIGIIAGSMGFSGAAYLSSTAVLKSGAGLVYSLIPKTINDIMEVKTTEVITIPIEDNDKGFFTSVSIESILNGIKDMDAIAVGPGIGVDEDKKDLIKTILKNYNKPIVLDADALNCIDDLEILKKRNYSTIITPHPGEMARLMKVTTEEIQNNRSKYAKQLSQKCNIITVLKGYNTIVDNKGNEQYINTTGNPGMATAGSGDVLTGIIAGLLGQGQSDIDASRIGVFIHGLAGDIAANEKGQYGITSIDILENVPYAIKYIISDCS